MTRKWHDIEKNYEMKHRACVLAMVAAAFAAAASLGGENRKIDVVAVY